MSNASNDSAEKNQKVIPRLSDIAKFCKWPKGLETTVSCRLDIAAEKALHRIERSLLLNLKRKRPGSVIAASPLFAQSMSAEVNHWNAWRCDITHLTWPKLQ